MGERPMEISNPVSKSAQSYQLRRSVASFTIFFALLVLVTGMASAQSRTAGVVGTVTDASGSVVAGAKVTVTNVLTHESKSTMTGDLGEYAVVDLLYGRYEVTVEKEGFKTLERRNLALEIGQQIKVDVVLVIGATAEVIEVKGDAPLLATQTATVDQVIAAKEVKDLPLVGRNWLDLATLAAGVVAPRATTGPGYSAGSAVTVNGNNADMNSFTIDGIENNAPLASNQALNPTIDAIQEFRIESSISPAEYGRAASQISVATKSGTNQWHGGLYEFFRNDKLDAKSYFDLAPKVPLRQNTFGGTVGGPIVKNKSFFFFSYDATRIRSSTTDFALIPPAAFINGDFSSFPQQLTDGFGNPLPGNQVPASSIHPKAAALLALYPRPNLSNPAYNYANVITNADSGYQWSMRVDHNFGQDDQLFVRASLKEDNGSTNGIFPIGIGGDTRENPGKSIGLSYTHTFSPNVINSLRLGYSFFDLRRIPEGYGKDFDPLLKPASIEDPKFGFLAFDLSGYTGIGFGDRWIKQPDHSYNLVDTLSWIHGKHTLKTGFDIRRWQNNLSESFSYDMGFDGRFTGNPVSDMLFGYGANAFSFGGHFASNLRRWDEAAFVMDDWRISPTLTMNLGLRWDYVGPLSDADNNLQNFDFATATTNIPGTPGYPTGNANRTFRDLNNFAPRIGIAWSPLSLPHTVFRTGYGVFYVPSEGQFDLILGPKDDPFYSFNGDVSNPNGLGLSNLAPLNTFVGGLPSVSAVDLHIRNPYVQQWHLTIQHQLKGNIVLQTGYTGNQGTKLGVIRPFNVPHPGPGPIQARSPYPAFGYMEINEQSGRSIYHGWQTKVEKRYSQGLSLLASYTWSKTIDNNSFLGFRVYNPFDVDQDKGLSDQDTRHRFVAGWTYELPFGSNKALLKTSGVLNAIVGGWSFGGIVTAESGMPFTATATGDPANWGNGTRPDVVGDTKLSNPNIQEWFNVGAFQAPAQFTIGNERRNILIGPGLHNWDLILAKQFRIREKHEFQFRSEFFNAFNHPQFEQPGATFGTPSFGVISSARPGRIIQFALKYNF
jgi:hypothetical protein